MTGSVDGRTMTGYWWLLVVLTIGSVDMTWGNRYTAGKSMTGGNRCDCWYGYDWWYDYEATSHHICTTSHKSYH